MTVYMTTIEKLIENQAVEVEVEVEVVELLLLLLSVVEVVLKEYGLLKTDFERVCYLLRALENLNSDNFFYLNPFLNSSNSIELLSKLLV